MRALELFCCSGGMAAGFREAGITFDFAFDSDPNACASYEANLGHRPIHMDVRDLLRMVRGGWSPGPLDLIVADPPCAPWSRAGKRNGLARTTTAAERGTRALLTHPKHPINKLDEPSYAVTARDPGGAQGSGAMSLERTPQGQRIGDPSAPGATVTAKASRVGAGESHVLAWPWNRPSTTVSTTDSVPPPGHHPESGSILSQPNAIVLSERAAAILQGFPDGWLFAGKTKAARWQQIGMAMPPALAAAVARSVRRTLESAADERGAA